MKVKMYILINYDTYSLNIFNYFFKIINNKNIKIMSTKYILCIYIYTISL